MYFLPDFYGKNNLEAAYIDQILDTITDLINTAIPYVIEKHENKDKKVQICLTLPLKNRENKGLKDKR